LQLASAQPGYSHSHSHSHLSEAVYSDWDTDDPHKTSDTNTGSFGLPEDVDVDGGLRKKLLFDEFVKEGEFKVFSFRLFLASFQFQGLRFYGQMMLNKRSFSL
jgi:hypothetical protein